MARHGGSDPVPTGPKGPIPATDGVPVPCQVAYTFDAGPNAVIFALEDTVPEFVAVLRRSFPPASNGDQ